MRARLDQPGEHIGRDARAERRVDLEQPRDVGEVLLARARTSRVVCDRPDLALQEILDAGDGQAEPEHVARNCAIDERGVARIDLNLDSEVRAGLRHVETVREALDDEGLAQECVHAWQLIGGHGEVEIQAHDGLGVGVDGLTVYQAVADTVVGKETNHAVEEVAPVVYHALPERLCAHAGSPVNPLSMVAGEADASTTNWRLNELKKELKG